MQVKIKIGQNVKIEESRPMKNWTGTVYGKDFVVEAEDREEAIAKVVESAKELWSHVKRGQVASMRDGGQYEHIDQMFKVPNDEEGRHFISQLKKFGTSDLSFRLRGRKANKAKAIKAGYRPEHTFWNSTPIEVADELGIYVQVDHPLYADAKLNIGVRSSIHNSRQSNELLRQRMDERENGTTKAENAQLREFNTELINRGEAYDEEIEYLEWCGEAYAEEIEYLEGQLKAYQSRLEEVEYQLPFLHTAVMKIAKATSSPDYQS